MQIRRARKKPVEIELVEYGSRHDVADILSWVGSERAWYDGTHIVIATLEGNHRANMGDWIIKGVKGEFYPIKPDIFEQTYDLLPREGALRDGEQADNLSGARD